MPRARALSLLLCAAALTLGACGGEEPVRVRDARLAVTLDDYRIEPQLVRFDRHGPGRLTIEIVNGGRIGHNFALRKSGVVSGRVSTLLPGERGRLRRRLTRGDYRMFCSVANHEELGMYGTLAVR